MQLVFLLATFLYPAAQGLSLFAQSRDACLDGRFVAENSSTDDGSTLVILAPQGSTQGVIGGFLSDQPPMANDTFFFVTQPMRRGGSEYDGWVIGPTNASGLAVPEVVPGQGTAGWSLVTTTENKTKIAFKRDNLKAKFFVCDRQLTGTGDPRQQLIFGFNATKPKGCKKVQLLASD